MDDRTLGEKVADYITSFGGSWSFISLFGLFLLIWVIINLFNFAFDKPPFILLNLILSFIAAFQAPFIMMSQNRAEKKQDVAYRMLFKEIKELVEQDIEIEKEIEKLSKEIKQEVREQHAKLLTILEKAAQY